MRAAPAVDYPVSQDGWWRRACAALGAVLSAVPVAWAGSHLLADRTVRSLADAGGAPAFVGLAVLAAAALGAWAGWRLSRFPASALRRISWDGGAWCLYGAVGNEPQRGYPLVTFDGGDRLLLRWYGDGATTSAGAPRRGACIPLARVDQPSSWHLLRVALTHAGGRTSAAHTGRGSAAP